MSRMVPRLLVRLRERNSTHRWKRVLHCKFCIDAKRNSPITAQSYHWPQTSKYNGPTSCLPITNFQRDTVQDSVRYYSNSVPNNDKDSGKFHQTMIQRLTSLEDSMRYNGYSTVRIGLCVVAALGLGVYIFREYIRENVAVEVSNVATMSLADTGVKMKVQELAVALIQTILNNPSIQSQAVQFLEDVFQNPATQHALISLLLHVLNDPVAQSQLTSTLKRAVDTSLSDEKFREQLAKNIRHLLRDESTKQGLLELVAYVFQDESMKRETEKFFKEVLSSKLVRDEASQLGKNTVKDVIGDGEVQKKTGDAMWTAFTYSVTPRLFSGGKGNSVTGSQNSASTATSASEKDAKETELPEENPSCS